MKALHRYLPARSLNVSFALQVTPVEQMASTPRFVIGRPSARTSRAKLPRLLWRTWLVMRLPTGEVTCSRNAVV
jgi:hypothetical protein